MRATPGFTFRLFVTFLRTEEYGQIIMGAAPLGIQLNRFMERRLRFPPLQFTGVFLP